MKKLDTSSATAVCSLVLILLIALVTQSHFLTLLSLIALISLTIDFNKVYNLLSLTKTTSSVKEVEKTTGNELNKTVRNIFKSLVPRKELYPPYTVDEIKRFEAGQHLRYNYATAYSIGQTWDDSFFIGPTDAFLRFSKLPYVTTLNVFEAMGYPGTRGLNFTNQELLGVLLKGLSSRDLTLEMYLEVSEHASFLNRVRDEDSLLKSLKQNVNVITAQPVINYLKLKTGLQGIKLPDSVISNVSARSPEVVENFIVFANDLKKNKIDQVEAEELLELAINI